MEAMVDSLAGVCRVNPGELQGELGLVKNSAGIRHTASFK